MRCATLLLLLASLAVGACSQEPAPPGDKPATPSFEIVTDLNQTMDWILDPAADVIWDSAGTIITAQGSQELAPTTDEGWDAVVHASATLTEAANLLMLPGRSQGADWDTYAVGLIQAGKLALKASQEKDADALFEAGGRIYQVCRACHNQYWVREDGRD